MNFKDVYKEANDEIKGDRKILDSVFDGSYAAQKEKKKSPARVIYAFGSVAAAAVILFSVARMPDFKKTPDETITPPEIELQSNADDTKTHEEAANASDMERKAEKKAEDPVQNKEKQVRTEAFAAEKNAPVQAESSGAFEEKQGPSDSAVNDKREEPAVTFSMSAAPETVTDNGESFADKSTDSLSEDGLKESKEDAGADMRTKASGASSGGGGGANSASTNSLPNVNEIPADEFFTLIGFSKEKLSLSGYSLTMPETASVIEDEEGNVLSASAEFYLSAEDSHISVTLSAGSDVTEKTVTVFSGGVSAYADNGEISAYISALNAEEQIISDYMDQLMKED